jgi:hypothetical protein
MNQMVNEPPKMVGVPGLAITQPHSLDRSTPKTNRPNPMTDSADPIRSIRLGSGGTSLTLRSTARMASTMTTSPKNTYRQDA